MKLSVVITAYNQHALTAVHVRECMNSTRVPDEIIVVNDGGTEDLKDKLLLLEKKCSIVYARVKQDIQWNYTGARNLGIWLSRGDRIAMEDNDNIPCHEFYEEALKLDADRVCSLQRPKISLEDALTKPYSEWKSLGARPYHRDTAVMKREVFLKLKGYDEDFSGKYGWVSTDWRRRLDKIGAKTENVSHYWAVVEGDTIGLIRRKSYANYDLARRGLTQNPSPILRFEYDYEVL